LQLPKIFNGDASRATLGTVNNFLLNMSSEGKRACAPAKRHLLVLLSSSQDKDWIKTCTEEIDDILKHTTVRDVLSCPCVECKEGRSRLAPIPGTNDVSTWVGKMEKSKRLFAICIIADLPYLIYPFLQRNFDDRQFDEYNTGTELAEDIGLSLENAKLLLCKKDAFFDGGRISLFTYIRSTKPRGDRPSVDERNWLIDEFLLFLEKLDLAPDAPARKLPKAVTVREIMIPDSPARPLDREAQAVADFGGQVVRMQSLGYLILDLICFIAGGGCYVQSLDKRRTAEPDWVKQTDWTVLDEIPELPKAFQLAWIMICSNENFGLSKDDRGNDNFKYVSQQFRRIWPHTTSHPLPDPEKEKNSDRTSLSSQGLGSPGNSIYKEIDPGIFRWMRVFQNMPAVMI
jgi:hypothetical protein